MHTYTTPGFAPVTAPSHHDAALQTVEQEKARASARHAVLWDATKNEDDIVYDFSLLGETNRFFSFSVTLQPNKP